MTSFLMIGIVCLLATVIAVPLSTRIGLGSVIGYLIAGVVIGPYGVSVVNDTDSLMHFSEFGVVMLLFIIGLELSPKRLWDMRRAVFGLGLAQVIICTGILTLTTMFFFKTNLTVAFITAMGLSLSSTALSVQIMNERHLMGTPAGKGAFAVLLSQDIAVIPMLAALPLLAKSAADTHKTSGWIGLCAIVGVILVGRYFIPYVFHAVAQSRSREVFTALSLLIVIGISAIMNAAGVSMALGAFLAGVVLANSEYRHELESNIEPFKGLLLGLFFMSVGMSIEIDVVTKSPGLILFAVVGLIVFKGAALFALGRFVSNERFQRVQFAILLSQGGEFAFVLFGTSAQLGLFTRDQTAFLNAVVALSMLTTPLLVKLAARESNRLKKIDEHETIENDGNPVIVAGFGRFGQIVARLLNSVQIKTTVIDHSPELISRVRRFGFKAYYGDATRIEILESAGLEKARLLVLAIDDRERMLAIIEATQHKYPHVKIVCRAFDMLHAYDLLDRGIKTFERETFDSALSVAEKALVDLGFEPFFAKRSAQKFKRHDVKTMYHLHEVHQDREQVASRMQRAREELEKLFVSDEQDDRIHSDSVWG